MRSSRGRAVRADWRLAEQEHGVRRVWAQELEGTPFEKLLTERRVEVRLAPVESGTRLTLTLVQRPRGWSRFGGLMLRRAAGKELNGALDNLEGML
jgi:hypothetical protein